MRGSPTMVARLAPLVLLGLSLAACGGGKSASPAPAAGPASAAVQAAVTLPADPLAALVPQPGEVPAGLLLVVKQSGPADAAKLAGFAGATAATVMARLAHDGFAGAYVVEYASPGGRILTVVVSRFATVAGATADLTADLTGTTAESGIGDQDGERTQALPGGAAGGQLDTERFRVGSLTYLVAVGGPDGVDIDDVRTVSRQLAERGAKS